jgi:hypothetical protein
MGFNSLPPGMEPPARIEAHLRGAKIPLRIIGWWPDRLKFSIPRLRDRAS